MAATASPATVKTEPREEPMSPDIDIIDIGSSPLMKPAVKTEPSAEIDIKEEPLDSLQAQEQSAAKSPAVAAAQQLLQHQLSGIKSTLTKASTQKVESVDSKASIIKDVNQNSKDVNQNSKDVNQNSKDSGSSQPAKERVENEEEEGELSDDDHSTASPSSTKTDVKPVIKKQVEEYKRAPVDAAAFARQAARDEKYVREGKAARMPVWVALTDEEEFPLPHWIGVSGTSSDNLNQSTKVVLETRLQEITKAELKEWDKEIRETEVRIDPEGVRRISSRAAAREVRRGGLTGGNVGAGRVQGRGFGQARPKSPPRRGRSRSPVVARRRSPSPRKRSPVRQRRSRSRSSDRISRSSRKRRERSRSRSSSVQSVRSGRRRSRSPAGQRRSRSSSGSDSSAIITRRTIKREKMSRSRSRSPVKSHRRDRSRSRTPKKSKKSKKASRKDRQANSPSPSPTNRRIKAEPRSPSPEKRKIKREPDYY